VVQFGDIPEAMGSAQDRVQHDCDAAALATKPCASDNLPGRSPVELELLHCEPLSGPAVGTDAHRAIGPAADHLAVQIVYVMNRHFLADVLVHHIFEKMTEHAAAVLRVPLHRLDLAR